MHTTGRRTRLRPGSEDEYVRVHAQIPEPVQAALAECGVIRWQIWRDGGALFHVIDTLRGYDAMLADLDRRGPVDPRWDAMIAALLESEPDDDLILPLVWSMNEHGQFGGNGDAVIRTPEEEMPS